MKYTLQELLKLADSDEGKQRIRVMVAELCGYTLTADQRWRRPGQTVGECGLPEFAKSLDDMAELVRGFTDPAFHKFCLNLSKLSWILYPDQTDQHSYMNRLRVSFAGAAIDHAIAFILTKQEVQP